MIFKNHPKKRNTAFTVFKGLDGIARIYGKKNLTPNVLKQAT